jgi:hypothetical protein
MYRVLTALFLLVATTVASSAQGLLPAIWQSQRGAILKVLWADAATGNFGGVFISAPGGPCPGVPNNVTGRKWGPRVNFVTTRTWTLDCRVTARWSGRLTGPTTMVARWTAVFVDANGRRVVRSGSEFFRRI